MREVNLSIPDAIHVATATDQDCNYFIASDTDLIESIKGKIDACTPERIHNHLEK